MFFKILLIIIQKSFQKQLTKVKKSCIIIGVNKLMKEEIFMKLKKILSMVMVLTMSTAMLSGCKKK